MDEKEYLKKWGAVSKTAQDLFDEKSILVPISPALDLGLGGGLSDGIFVVLAGPPTLGKTITSLQIAQAFQDPAYLRPTFKKRKIFFYNIENRLKKRDLEGILGLDYSEEAFTLITSCPEQMLNAEQYLTIAELNIVSNPGSIHILDSFSALCTESELTKGMDEMQRADGPKLLAKFCRKIATAVSVNHCVLIGINHIMGNPSGKGAETKEKGGYATAYQADVKLLGKWQEPVKDAKEVPIGQIAHWQTTKTATNTPPGRMIDSYIRYGVGVDKAMEVAVLGVELGVITQKGAWYSYGEDKWQGQEKMRNAIFADKKLYDEIYGKIRELVL